MLGSGFYSSAYARVGATGITLVVRDALGKTAKAEGVVLVSEPPPPPDDGGDWGGSGAGDGGGGGGGSYTIYICIDWEISYDSGLTWLPDGRECYEERI